VNEEVERLRAQQRAVSDVSRAVARSEGLQPVLDEIVEAATRLCAGDNGRLWLVRDGLLHVLAGSGDEVGYEHDRQHPHAVDRSTMAGRAALSRRPVHVADVDADPEYTYPGPRRFRANLSIPILLEEELIGVIGIVRREPAPFSDDEIELVQTFADQAAIAIANARLLDAVERQRTELARFVSPQVAELLSSEDGEHLLAGHRAYITVLFSDLRGFTAFVETAAPEDLFDVLREYHELVGELVAGHGGTLEHFAGDGVMMFFNDPAPLDDHEIQAVRMALALQQRFAELAIVWEKRGIKLGLGIGIASGYATLGRIGFDGRYDYGALGPVVNLASRLSSEAEAGQILISQRLLAAVEEAVAAMPVGDVELKGFARPVAVFEARGLLSS
jgi:class 3 adenylate cyclase